MIQIGKKDILWNYAATFLKITSSALLLPLILRMMPAETVGIWSIFTAITSFASLFDLGFNPSFSRNVTYVLSGVRSLKTSGYESININEEIIDYGLLKGLIKSMQWFYSRISLLVFVLLTVFGTIYIHQLLINYRGDHSEVYTAWFLLCIINTYKLYTFYYDCLLQGKGLIRQSKQIIIVGQSTYLIIASILILKGFGLIAIVSAQASSVLIIRGLSYKVFFSAVLKNTLQHSIAYSKKKIIKAIYPNALKIGLTSLGSFMITRSAIIIGSLYLSLEQIASYGITIQIIGIIISFSGIYTTTYLPKIVQLRVKNQTNAIKNLYIKGQIVQLITFFLAGLGFLILGPLILGMIGSKTQLMPFTLTAIALIVALEETNLSLAGDILLTKNEVPFFKASLISGALIVIGLYAGFEWLKMGAICMVLVPLIVDLSYQAWKWPLVAARDLDLKPTDIIKVFAKYFFNNKLYKI